MSTTLTPIPARRRNSSGRGRRRPLQTGSDSELAAMCALRAAGFRVYQAWMAPDDPCDCVIDDGARLARVQIETGFLHPSQSVRWATRSAGRGYERGYHGAADFYAVWLPERAECYLVPVAECGQGEASLRLEPARNGQVKGTRLASAYLVRPAERTTSVAEV